MENLVSKIKTFQDSNPVQLRTKPDSRPMKLLPTLYHRKLKDDHLSFDHNINHSFSFTRTEEKEAMTYVMERSGCRVSELLDSFGHDILSDSEFIIHGKKGSGSRVLRFPELSQILSDSKHYPERRIFLTRYITFYRWLIERGKYMTAHGNINRSVTHSFRYHRIAAISEVSRNDKTTADCIGHRSKRTSRRYIDKGENHV